MPVTFTAGDTLKFSKSLSGNYPPDAWTLTYTLVNAKSKINFDAADNGDGTYLVTVGMTTTAAWEPGQYSWQATVSDGSERFEVDTGQIEIGANFASASQYDGRNHVEKVLAAIEAVMENRATETDLSYSVGGRSLSKMSLSEIMEAYSFYKIQLRQIENARRVEKGLGSQNKILTRFV